MFFWPPARLAAWVRGGLFFSLVWAACAAGGVGMHDGRSEDTKAGLSFERRFVCAAGTGTFLFFVLLAACAAGGVGMHGEH